MKFILVFFFFVVNLFFYKNCCSREFNETRAVWLATVSNIDWPLSRFDDTDKQKKDLISYLNLFKEYKINTVFFQIRPSFDALYYSPYEPWSKYLTGSIGNSPMPKYDPLAFLIKEAKKRNIDVHVWINPFRFITNVDDKKNLFYKNLIEKGWTVEYGKKYYANPGIKEVREHVKKITLDIVRRYDIDGVHFDDYFYPYPVKGQYYNDYDIHKKYKTNQSIKDWRRNNINNFIFSLSDSIKKIKPYVQFGISPFAVWRNKNKDTLGSVSNTLSCYDDLYADVYKWIIENKIDYVVPQLYWKIDFKRAKFNDLIDWWTNLVKTTRVNLFIGYGLHNYFSTSKGLLFNDLNEIPNQLKISSKENNIKGFSFYSASYFKKSPDEVKFFIKNNFFSFYSIPALIKRKNDTINYVINKLSYNKKHKYLLWKKIKTNKKEDWKYFVIYRVDKKKITPSSNIKDFLKTNYIIGVTAKNWFKLRSKKNEDAYYFVTSVNRYNRQNGISKVILVNQKN